MTLRLASETEVARSGADEGEGTGFDNLNLGAYAERVLVSPNSWEEIRAFFTRELTVLGWQETPGDRRVPALYSARSAGFRRHDDEHVQVQLLPMQEYWTTHFGRPGPFVRVSYFVAHHEA